MSRETPLRPLSIVNRHKKGPKCWVASVNKNWREPSALKTLHIQCNATIYDLTQAAPLMENVRTRQLSFLGHILRLRDEEPCKENALYIPPHGKRKPGRQRTLFLTHIQHLLGDTDNMIGPDKLSELAQNRCGWKKIVVACSAADRWWWYTIETPRYRVFSFAWSMSMFFQPKQKKRFALE